METSHLSQICQQWKNSTATLCILHWEIFSFNSAVQSGISKHFHTSPLRSLSWQHSTAIFCKIQTYTNISSFNILERWTAWTFPFKSKQKWQSQEQNTEKGRTISIRYEEFNPSDKQAATFDSPHLWPSHISYTCKPAKSKLIWLSGKHAQMVQATHSLGRSDHKALLFTPMKGTTTGSDKRAGLHLLLGHEWPQNRSALLLGKKWWWDKSTFTCRVGVMTGQDYTYSRCVRQQRTCDSQQKGSVNYCCSTLQWGFTIPHIHEGLQYNIT